MKENHKREKLLALLIWTLAGLGIFVYLLIRARTQHPYLLKILSGPFEKWIVSGQNLQDWAPHQASLIAIGFGIFTVLIWNIALIRFKKLRTLPLILTGLLFSGLGQYLIIKDLVFIGTWCHIWSGLPIILAVIRLTGDILNKNPLSLITRWILFGLAMAVSFTFLFYRLDIWTIDFFSWSQPNFYDLMTYWTGERDVFKHAVVWGQGRETTSGENIIYVAMSFSFFKIFGVRVLTLRLLNAIAGFITLGLVYRFCRRYYNSKIGILTVFLMGFSPWYNLYTRSETHVFFTMPLGLLAVWAFMNGFIEKRRVYFFWAGIVCSIIPYFYSVNRFLPFFLIFILLINALWKLKEIRRFNFYLKNAILPIIFLFAGIIPPTTPQLLFTGMIPTSLPQYEKPGYPVRNFFSGRGEQIFNMTRSYWYMEQIFDEDPGQPPYSLMKRLDAVRRIVTKNTRELLRNFSGLMEARVALHYHNFLNPYLFPFLICGVYIGLSRILQARYWLLLLWGFNGIFPTLGSNLVTPGRPLPALIPMFILIAHTFTMLLSEIRVILGKWFGRLVNLVLLAVFITGISTCEVGEFFDPADKEKTWRAPHTTAYDIEQEIMKNPVYVVYASWYFYDEGVIRIETYEERQKPESHPMHLYFQDADFQSLVQDLDQSPRSFRPSTFYFPLNIVDARDEVVKPVLERVRRNYPNARVSEVGRTVLKIQIPAYR